MIKQVTYNEIQSCMRVALPAQQTFTWLNSNEQVEETDGDTDV
jgi:hypothetical protein